MSAQSPGRPIPRIFVSYAYEDRGDLEQLQKHLRPLVQAGEARIWSADSQVAPGERWTKATDGAFEQSVLVIALISADYLASGYLSSVEAPRVAEAGRSGGKVVLPVIVRPCLWERSPFRNFRALPRDSRPVSQFRVPDEAWLDVVQAVRRVLVDIIAPQRPDSAETRSLPLGGVFKLSGVPTETFVEPPDYALLKLSLAQPGRGLVIEGPSGSGKTTSLVHARRDLRAHGAISRNTIQVLSARRADHRELIERLPYDQVGTVVVDDFHRLPLTAQKALVDHLKYLADAEDPERKVAIVGIPRTGQRLVSYSFDLATRIDVFRVGRVDDDLVEQVIARGEEALNVVFRTRTELVTACRGSMNVAQMLSYYLCALDGVEMTQPSRRTITASLQGAVERALAQVEPKFGPTARWFVSLGGPRDFTTLEIVKELVQSHDGYVGLAELRVQRKELRTGIDRLLSENLLTSLDDPAVESDLHMLFDPTSSALIIDDPQLAFYLAQTPGQELERSVGKSATAKRNQVFISYSHADGREWLERVKVHLKPLQRSGLVSIWDDGALGAGGQWREDISAAIDAAAIAILLVSANFLASDFIANDELPPLLSAAREDGAVVIPVLVSPSRFADTPSLSQFQSVNPGLKPLTGFDYNQQEEIFLHLSREVDRILARV
jgi:TIR domain